jgi:heme a synthase
VGMTLDEFKFIFGMEWFHRMWGRGLGVAFAIPALYFASKRYIKAPLAIRMSAIFALGGAQGLIGWLMVKSGLEEPQEGVTPRVSPYRLAAHLMSAFVIYISILHTGLDVWTRRARTLLTDPAALKVVPFRRLALLSTGMVLLTVTSGAFVAGNDAGYAYNDFPYMGGQWVPDDIWELSPGWKNIFENVATVQFDHRYLVC